MRNKVLAMTGAMMLMLFAICATCEACVTFTSHDTYTIDESGCVK